jgi:predicted DNA-binding transcriptional regulator YafY
VPKTGRRYATVIKQSGAQPTSEQLHAALAKMQALKLYPREKLENQRLLAFATAALRELDAERRAELERTLDVYEHWLNQNDADTFRSVRSALIEVLESFGISYREEPQ